MNHDERMGQAIRRKRKDAGIGGLRPFEDRLARFGLTLDRNTLSRIERGLRPVTVSELLVIAAATGVSPDVLAVPDDGEEETELSPTVVESTRKVREWFGGRVALTGTVRRPPRPSWPDKPTGYDAVRDARQRWEASRPVAERRMLDYDGARGMLAGVARFAKHAGGHATPAQDRANMVAALQDVIQGAGRLLTAFDGLDSKARRGIGMDAVNEMKTILHALTEMADDEGDEQ